jgi:predicted DNA-binding protein (MmcQ/YjbR family)
MDLNELEAYILSFRKTEKTFPFGEDVVVFKVCGKMFALLAWNEKPLRITLKCDPSEALLLRNEFLAIQAGYHMNKDHWNTISIDETIPGDLLFDMIETSYALVVKGLTKSEKAQLE